MGSSGGIPSEVERSTQASDELAELLDFYDHSPCGYCTLDTEGRITRVNRTALEWLGLTAEQTVGQRNLREFFTERSKADFDTVMAWFGKKRRVDGVELELRGAAGRNRSVRVTATTAYDAKGGVRAVRIVLYDVTEMLRLKEDMAALNLEQAAMLHSDLIGIMRLKQRRIVWKNRTLEAMLGYEHDALLGQSTRQLYDDDATFDSIGKEAYPLVDGGGLYRTQVRMRRQDGSLIWVDMNGVKLSAKRGESLWMLLDITALKQYQEQVEHIAFHDALTGLPNRLLLADRLSQALKAAARNGTTVAVCFLDLDGFKPVNDNFGHEVGDRLLKVLAERLRQCTRSCDTVARLGGDEFVVVAPADPPGHWEVLTRRIVEAVARPAELGNGVTVQVSTSIGVALYPAHAQKEFELLNLADGALYRAKRAGKNQVRFVGDERPDDPPETVL